MTSDLSSALEVCFKRDALKQIDVYFTLLYFNQRSSACHCSWNKYITINTVWSWL